VKTLGAAGTTGPFGVAALEGGAAAAGLLPGAAAAETFSGGAELAGAEASKEVPSRAAPNNGALVLPVVTGAACEEEDIPIGLGDAKVLRDADRPEPNDSGCREAGASVRGAEKGCVAEEEAAKDEDGTPKDSPVVEEKPVAAAGGFKVTVETPRSPTVPGAAGASELAGLVAELAAAEYAGLVAFGPLKLGGPRAVAARAFGALVVDAAWTKRAAQRVLSDGAPASEDVGAEEDEAEKTETAGTPKLVALKLDSPNADDVWVEEMTALGFEEAPKVSGTAVVDGAAGGADEMMPLAVDL
jgi:hypothetical protein